MISTKELDQVQEARDPGDVMRAIVQDAYGDASVLHLAGIDRPAIAANEVLLKVRAAGMDRGTWHFMTGQPYLFRMTQGLSFSRQA